MAQDTLAPYQEWKKNFLDEIDSLPHAVAKGDAFVSEVLQAYYSLSEDDAINATECAGAGDCGVDAIYVFPVEQNASAQDVVSPRILVVQGKYGAAGLGLDIYQESQKFINALQKAQRGEIVTDAIEKVAGVLGNDGQVNYVIVTVDPLNDTQQRTLENIKKLANVDFADKLTVESISLENIYALLDTEKKSTAVTLSGKVVSMTTNAYVGIVRLTDMYSMLIEYSKQNSGALDSIYDHNIRKYIKRSSSSVNSKIYETLQKDPSHFIAYNNGITITCHETQLTEQGLRLTNPQIVNGCQTTRTIYEFMDKHFAGIHPQHDAANKMAAYREAFMAIKILVVSKDEAGVTYAKDITRYSNKQNVIRGRDFIALEDMYRGLKNDMKKIGYFLQTQKGEYATLSKAQQKKYPLSHVIDSFEATLFYVAGVLGKPQDAFGNSGDFAPGGQKFESFINKLTADGLFVPWAIAQRAQLLGYTKGKSKNNPEHGTGHRAQTRHLFQYMFFRLVREMIAEDIAKKKDSDITEVDIYSLLNPLITDYDSNPSKDHPFYQLMLLTDAAVSTFMKLAEKKDWYDDRNAFLKSQALMDEEHLIAAIEPVTVQPARQQLPTQIQQILAQTKTSE